MKQRIISLYLASLVVLFASGITAANTSKAKIASGTIEATGDKIAKLSRLSPSGFN